MFFNVSSHRVGRRPPPKEEKFMTPDEVKLVEETLSKAKAAKEALLAAERAKKALYKMSEDIPPAKVDRVSLAQVDRAVEEALTDFVVRKSDLWNLMNKLMEYSPGDIAASASTSAN
jgi:hypothetical protein